MTDNERPTPLTDAFYKKYWYESNGLSSDDVFDHARTLERQRDEWREMAVELAKACKDWENYDWHGGASGLSLVDVRKKITKALAKYEAMKGQSK